MLKLEETFKDFDGNERTGVFYFNLSKAELLEMETTHPGGWGKYLRRIVSAKDQKALTEEFKWLLLQTYGEKSDDGVHFMKSDEIRQRFECHAVFSELFTRFSLDENEAQKFINAVLPKELVDEVAAEVKAAAEKGTTVIPEFGVASDGAPNPV